MTLRWIPLLPLLGFLVNGVWYLWLQTGKDGSGAERKRAGAAVTGGIASAAIFGSFLISLRAFIELRSMSEHSRVIEDFVFSWITVPGLALDVIFRVDPLSTLFTLVITGVGTLIHIYSIGYMGHDETPGKFFAYLNLFCFAMLVLVLGGSLPLLFFGWEGVGLCSYLLIGYWYEDIEKAKAGKKAFVVNRIGDFGFLLGMFLIWTTFGTLDFVALKSAASALPAAPAVLTAIGLLLFVGCSGKSAQFPLYIWLPDAMAGPTPVSALIHAATMVTSGVYLIARLNFIYSAAPDAMHVVAAVGAFTAFFAATIAIAQTDIKKVLAYSTVSQLGYMFLACGVGGYVAGVFHVVTHAFFKALLFLGAGSVIHGMHHEQDILKMGGLRKVMPATFGVFTIGWLAICGIPPFSGFFSKDEILWLAFSSEHGSKVLWVIAAATAMMTAFYMTRMYWLTFFGKGRYHGHPHESPAVMVLPLVVLAVLSAVGGAMGIPHASWLEHWLEPVIPAHHGTGAGGVDPQMEWVLMGLSVLGAAMGIAVAIRTYADFGAVARLRQQFKRLHHALSNKWFVDEIFEASVVRPIQAISQRLWKWMDVGVVDRAALSFGWVSSGAGHVLRMTQTGSLQRYGWVLLIGWVLSLAFLVRGWV